MKIKKGFMLREVAGEYVVVPVGKASLEFKGLITLNEVGAFLFKALEKDISKETLLNKVLEEYDVKEEIALKDIEAFLNKLKDAKILDE